MCACLSASARQLKASDKGGKNTFPHTMLQADDWSESKPVTWFLPLIIAELKPENRSTGICQRGTMATASEPDPGITEEPEEMSLDQRETRRRRGGRFPF